MGNALFKNDRLVSDDMHQFTSCKNVLAEPLRSFHRPWRQLNRNLNGFPAK